MKKDFLVKNTLKTMNRMIIFCDFLWKEQNKLR